MRDINRIDKFCLRLASLWKECCPDWRFGQLISNVFGEIAGKAIDVFFPEEDKMMDLIKESFPKYKEKEGYTAVISGFLDINEKEPDDNAHCLVLSGDKQNPDIIPGHYSKNDGVFKGELKEDTCLIRKDNVIAYYPLNDKNSIKIIKQP